MNKHKNNGDNNNMDWSNEYALLYHYSEYEIIESVWMEQLGLPQLQRKIFNNDECDFKVKIVVGIQYKQTCK